MQILTDTGWTDIYRPAVKVAQACIDLEREKIDAINGSIARYNETIEAAQSQGREIGWFPDRVHRDTGEIWSWGPRPQPINKAPFLVLPEWAK